MTTSTIKQIEALAQRFQKAHQIVQDQQVQEILGKFQRFVVVKYTVDTAKHTCTCPDAEYRQQGDELVQGSRSYNYCKHLLAALIVEQAAADLKIDPELERKVDELFS